MIIDIVAPRTAFFLPDRLEYGLGGNEATLVLWWREFSVQGATARVFLAGSNDTGRKPPPTWGTLAQRAWTKAAPADVIIGWRDAAPLATVPPRKLRVLYTGDRMTPGIGVMAANGGCDLVFTGSSAALLRYQPQIEPRRGFIVDSCGHALPSVGAVTRRRFRCVHSSAPYRGLAHLLRLWPRIRDTHPDADLVIMGGYQLWGYSDDAAASLAMRDVPQLRQLPAGVRYLGPVSRSHYARVLASAEVMLYPTSYEEMCCIAALEAAASGAVPVLSASGALTDRVVHGHSGLLIPGDIADPDVAGRYALEASDLLNSPTRLRRMSAAAQAQSRHHSVSQVIGRLLNRISA